MRQVESHSRRRRGEIIDCIAGRWLSMPMHARPRTPARAAYMVNVKFDSRTETLEDPSLVTPATR